MTSLAVLLRGSGRTLRSRRRPWPSVPGSASRLSARSKADVASTPGRARSTAWPTHWRPRATTGSGSRPPPGGPRSGRRPLAGCRPGSATSPAASSSSRVLVALLRSPARRLPGSSCRRSVGWVGSGRPRWPCRRLGRSRTCSRTGSSTSTSGAGEATRSERGGAEAVAAGTRRQPRGGLGRRTGPCRAVPDRLRRPSDPLAAGRCGQRRAGPAVAARYAGRCCRDHQPESASRRCREPRASPSTY